MGGRGGAPAVEEFDLDDAATAPRGHASLRTRDVAWRWLAIGGLLTTIGVIAAPPHPSTDGINLVASLATAPQLAWEAPLTSPRPSTRLDADVVGDIIAVTTDGAVAAYDMTSGDRRWQVALMEPRCTYQEQIVCVTGRGAWATVTTISPRNGASETLQLPDAAWALRAGDDVVALVYAERTQSVVRVHDDEVLWSTEVPYQPGIGGVARGYPFARIDNRLYVGTAGPAVLDLDTGATLARPLQLRYDPSGIFGLGFNETWWHLWSGEQVALAESSARLGVDDDLRAPTEVLISAATGITQLREGKDEPFWSGIGGEDPLARLDGVLVTYDDRNLATHGIDLRTGTQLWSSEAMSCPCLGAGDVLLLSSSQTVPAGLTAIDVHTGLPAWQLAFPPATSLVQLVDGGALAFSDDQLVMYRW